MHSVGYNKYKYTYYQNIHRIVKTPPHVASSKTDKNEFVNDGVHFLSALLGDPSINVFSSLSLLFTIPPSLWKLTRYFIPT